MKKHEAIEADISSYQERIQVVLELAQEVESEGYYDSRRIIAQKDNILRQWGLLTELVSARRARLEQNVALQKIFQEMVYMIDWMEDLQVWGLPGGTWGGLQGPCLIPCSATGVISWKVDPTPCHFAKLNPTSCIRAHGHGGSDA